MFQLKFLQFQLIQFVAKVKNGEVVDIEEFTKPKLVAKSSENQSSSPEKSKAEPRPKKPSAGSKQKVDPSLQDHHIQQLVQLQLQQQQQMIIRQQILLQQQQLLRQQQQTKLQRKQQEQQLLRHQQDLLCQQLLLPQIEKSSDVHQNQSPLPPFILEYLAAADKLPDLTVAQAVELERLLVKHRDIPTPDQASLVHRDRMNAQLPA